MVKLRNITRDDKRIWCDYYPEFETEAGLVVVDLKTDEIIDARPTEYERKLETTVYAKYAALKLSLIKEQKTLPEKASYIWY